MTDSQIRWKRLVWNTLMVLLVKVVTERLWASTTDITVLLILKIQNCLNLSNTTWAKKRSMLKITWLHGLILSNHQFLNHWEKSLRRDRSFSREDSTKIKPSLRKLKSSTSNKLQPKQVKAEQKECFHQQSLFRIDTLSLTSKVAVCRTDNLICKIKLLNWAARLSSVVQEIECQNLRDTQI